MRHDVAVRDVLQTALWLRSWGFTCIPVGPSKQPVGPWKTFQTRKPTDRQIGELFSPRRRGRPVSGLAVVLGRASGGRDWSLAALDFDRHDEYERWAAARPDLAAECPTVKTKRGRHVYARLRGPEQFLKFPWGELRASHRQYVVLPPSLHPSDIRYEWDGREPTALSDFPFVDLADLLPSPPPSPLHPQKNEDMACVPPGHRRTPARWPRSSWRHCPRRSGKPFSAPCCGGPASGTTG